MKFKILAGSLLLATVTFTFVDHEHNMETIQQQKLQIDSQRRSIESQDQYVSELEKKLQKVTVKLTDSQKENKRLQDKLNSVLKLEATAYIPKCSTGCSGITKSGLDVTHRKTVDGMRVVAVDPDLIPLGTTMTVHTEDKTFDAIALDTGEDIQGHRMDVLFLNEDKAEEFGRQDVVVQVTGHMENFRSLE